MNQTDIRDEAEDINKTQQGGLLHRLTAGIFSTHFASRRETAFASKELAKIDSAEFVDFDKVSAKKTVQVYLEMRYDEQVKFCLLMKKFLILASGWEVVPADETPEAKEQADFVRACFDDTFGSLDQSFGTILYQMLSAIEYGYSVSEKLWKRMNVPVYGDRIVLKNIKTKFPWDIEFKYDEFGGLKSFTIKGEEMPIEKFVIWSYMGDFGNMSGESDLKAVYNAWWFKNIVWKFWARHLERFGSPIVKGHVPSGASQAEKDMFFRIINRLHQCAGVMLPRTAIGKEEFDFELVESKREGGGQFSDAMENADGRIARGFNMPRLIGATKEQFGSYALGFEQFRIVYKFVKFVADTFSQDAIGRQVVRPLINYNYAVPKYPKFKIKEFDEATFKAMISDAGEVTFPSKQESSADGGVSTSTLMPDQIGGGMPDPNGGDGQEQIAA